MKSGVDYEVGAATKRVYSGKKQLILLQQPVQKLYLMEVILVNDKLTPPANNTDKE